MADFLDAKIIFADTVDTVHAVVAGSVVAVELFSVLDGVAVNSAMVVMLLSFLMMGLMVNVTIAVDNEVAVVVFVVVFVAVEGGAAVSAIVVFVTVVDVVV